MFTENTKINLVSSTENDINMWLAKVWTGINRLSVIWKSDLTDKMKQFFPSNGCIDTAIYCARMLWAVLNKSWKQHPSRQQLYGHLPAIMKTIQVRWTRHVRQCWKSKDELISDILLWTPSQGWAKAGRPARTYIQQFCTDIGCSLDDLLGAMDNRDRCRERVREIHASSTTSWWFIQNMHGLCPPQMNY